MKNKTMKALVYYGPNDLRLEDAPMPKIMSPDDAIVKVTLSTICGSDLHIQGGHVPEAGPGMIIGHEFVGEIVEVGPAVSPRLLVPGDRVAAACSVSCGVCYYCKKGETAHCVENIGYFGCTQSLNGCQTEYVRIPRAMSVLHRIPAGLDDEDALFVGDILSTGYFGALNGQIKNGDVVAVMGCGPVGMCTLACAGLFGPSLVIAVDTVDSRLEAALQNGICDIALNPLRDNVVESIRKLTEGRGADVTIEAAGAKPTYDMAFEAVRPAGQVSAVGFLGREYTLDMSELWMKNVGFKQGKVNVDHIPTLLALIKNGRLDMKFMITHKKPLNDVLEGYDVFGNKKDGCIKWAITPYEY